MDEVVCNCETKQEIQNDGGGDVSIAVLEKQLVEHASHYSKDNKSSSKESDITDLQETDTGETVHNCEIMEKIPNDGGGDFSIVVLAEKALLGDTSHGSEDRKSSSKESDVSDLHTRDIDDMVHVFQIKLSMENENSDGIVNNDNLADNPVDEVLSYYSKENKSSYKASKFTYLQEAGNNEVSSKDDVCIEDESTVKNFENFRDMENGIDVEHILSCLKSLQCPFVWKPDKEVEIHPRGEVPTNLAQHLTDKERGFICMETDLFREVTIYLVLAYHKCITMSTKEALLDIYHCYDILLKAEKEIFKLSVERANEDTSRMETNISDISTSVTQYMKEDLNSALVKSEVFSVLCNSRNSPQENENDYEDVFKAEGIQSSSVMASTDYSRCGKQRKSYMEFLVKNDVEDTELFSKLFDTMTHCEWKNANTAQKNVFENWKTESNNVITESCCSTIKLPEDKAKKCSETQLYNHSNVETERELQKLYALQYVTAASLAHFAFSFGCGQDVMQIMEYAENLYKSLNSVGEAVILALRGAVLCEYGYVGNKLALPLFKEALTLDPDNWEWNLYCAKIIGRLRRNEKTCNTEPSEEEIQMLKKAVELNPTNPSCLVHLANAYRTLAGAHYRQRLVAQAASACDDPLLNSRLQRNWRSSRSSWRQDELWKQMPVTSKSNKEYLCMAKELYLEALKYGKKCPYTNARCAKGLWSMPNPYKDKKIAQETILHALCLAPDDSLVNHHAGMFYEYCHDYDKALSCYEIATQNGKFNYPAEMNYINLRLKISAPGSYSPIFRLHGLLQKYNGVNHMVQTLCLRGYYHYEIEKILLLAIQNFAMAIELKPTSPILTDFYPGQMLKNYPESINIYDLLEQILHDFESHPEHSINKDIVTYASDILKMGKEIRAQIADEKFQETSISG